MSVFSGSVFNKFLSNECQILVEIPALSKNSGVERSNSNGRFHKSSSRSLKLSLLYCHGFVVLLLNLQTVFQINAVGIGYQFAPTQEIEITLNKISVQAERFIKSKVVLLGNPLSPR